MIFCRVHDTLLTLPAGTKIPSISRRNSINLNETLGIHTRISAKILNELRYEYTDAFAVFLPMIERRFYFKREQF